MKEKIYQIVDSFLTEAKDQNGKGRSPERLNQDRHLAVGEIMEIISNARKESIEFEKERIKSKVGILRQYLNEKENDYFITDEEILTLLN